MSTADPQYAELLALARDARGTQLDALLEELHERYLALARGGVTPSGLPYPAPTDPVAEGADAIRTLAEAIDLRGRWADYAATWQNLVVGNGTVRSRFAEIGSTVLFEVSLALGSSTAISGTVAVSLPVPAAFGQRAGAGFYRPGAAGSLFLLTGHAIASTTVIQPMHSATTLGVGSPITAAAPAAPSAGGLLYLSGTYERAGSTLFTDFVTEAQREAGVDL